MGQPHKKELTALTISANECIKISLGELSYGARAINDSGIVYAKLQFLVILLPDSFNIEKYEKGISVQMVMHVIGY